MSLIFTVDIRRDTSRFGLCRIGASPCRSDTNRQQMKNPLKRCFKGFCLILSLKLLDLERKTRLKPALRVGNFSRTIFTPPTPKRGDLGSLVANLVFCSKRSLPYQREVWRDCLYGCGLFRETHKKRIALCYPSCVERKTRLELATPTLARLCSTN